MSSKWVLANYHAEQSESLGRGERYVVCAGLLDPIQKKARVLSRVIL